jgi:death-on-curing protein
VVRYLDLADYLVIAEAVTGIAAETLLRSARIHLAESALHAPAAGFGEVEFYPSFEMKAAVLCARLARNHPLPDGNKRAAYLSLLEFGERNGRSWRKSPNDPDETVQVMEAVAAGELSEADLADWIRSRFA